jgi:hypothetical protein
VVEIMNDDRGRERMRRDIAAYVHNVISWERVATRYDAIYKEALERARGASGPAADAALAAP